MIRKELLDCLLCPATRTRLTPADAALVARVNEAVAVGRLRNVGGQVVERPIEEGLVREDEAVLYAVRDGIPIMLVDEGIPLAQLGE
jgi:uncharacterized protein YbaR (Trm112 family)